MSLPNYLTLELEPLPRGYQLRLNRPERRNAISPTMLAELHQALTWVEADEDARYLILRGNQACFCTGMDFTDFNAANAAGQLEERPADDAYLRLLERLACSRCITLANVEGQTIAGGVGIVAACDLVFAAPTSSFALSEALFGLLPCCVTPFLIRRIGYQRAMRMTLTTTAIDGACAAAWGLVDELGDRPEALVKRMLPRLCKLDPATVLDMKRFFERMWFVGDDHKADAVAETARLMAMPENHTRIAARLG